VPVPRYQQEKYRASEFNLEIRKIENKEVFFDMTWTCETIRGVEVSMRISKPFGGIRGFTKREILEAKPGY